jgi:pyrroloquinoline quinone (PQQ) biosynthesis protein C
VDRLPPDPETAEILGYFHRLSREEWWVEALAAVGVGLEASPLALQESGGEAAASMLATLLQDRYGLTEHDVEFFRMHVFEDVEHTRRTMEIIKRYASSPDVAERIENRVRDAAGRLVTWMQALREESYRRVPA